MTDDGVKTVERDDCEWTLETYHGISFQVARRARLRPDEKDQDPTRRWQELSEPRRQMVSTDDSVELKQPSWHNEPSSFRVIKAVMSTSTVMTTTDNNTRDLSRLSSSTLQHYWPPIECLPTTNDSLPPTIVPTSPDSSVQSVLDETTTSCTEKESSVVEQTPGGSCRRLLLRPRRRISASHIQLRSLLETFNTTIHHDPVYPVIIISLTSGDFPPSSRAAHTRFMSPITSHRKWWLDAMILFWMLTCEVLMICSDRHVPTTGELHSNVIRNCAAGTSVRSHLLYQPPRTGHECMAPYRELEMDRRLAVPLLRGRTTWDISSRQLLHGKRSVVVQGFHGKYWIVLCQIVQQFWVYHHDLVEDSWRRFPQLDEQHLWWPRLLAQHVLKDTFHKGSKNWILLQHHCIQPFVVYHYDLVVETLQSLRFENELRSLWQQQPTVRFRQRVFEIVRMAVGEISQWQLVTDIKEEVFGKDRRGQWTLALLARECCSVNAIFGVKRLILQLLVYCIDSIEETLVNVLANDCMQNFFESVWSGIQNGSVGGFIGFLTTYIEQAKNVVGLPNATNLHTFFLRFPYHHKHMRRSQSILSFAKRRSPVTPQPTRVLYQDCNDRLASTAIDKMALTTVENAQEFDRLPHLISASSHDHQNTTEIVSATNQPRKSIDAIQSHVRNSLFLA